MNSKTRRLRKSIKAISPVLAVLMMIAIAIAGSLITYAWVTGYIGFTTEKAGKAIMIQSVANAGNNLLVYVQNVGEGTVELNPENCLYRNGELIPCDITINGVPVAAEENGLLSEGDTAELTLTDGAAAAGEKVTVKVTTLLGTFTEKSSYPALGQVAYLLTVETVGTGGAVTKNPDQETYSLGDVVELSVTVDPGWIFSGWSGDLTGNDNPATVTVTGTMTITATFIQLIETTLLADDFESWNTWDTTSSQWYLSPDQDHSGRYSAKSTDGHEGYFDCDPLNTQGSVAVTLDFWYRLSGGVDGGDFEVRFYDGSNWDYIADLGDQGEGSWQHFAYTTTHSQYFKSNFRIRFDSSLSGSETVWIDDIKLIQDSVVLLDGGIMIGIQVILLIGKDIPHVDLVHTLPELETIMKDTSSVILKMPEIR